MTARVEGKISLVTGAGSGLGKAIAKLLVEEGAQVILTDINSATGAVAARETGALFLPQDVARAEDWLRVTEKVMELYDRLDILVNNAGFAGPGLDKTPEHTTLEDWNHIQAVNSTSVFLGCKAAIPLMAKSGGGSIVNISSIAALVQTWFNTPYGASKAAVRQLTQSVAVYCARKNYGIRCNSIHPGQIMTPMLEGLLGEDGEGGSVREEFLKKIPMGEFGEPRDIAYAVLYLCSDEAKHVTGSQLLVDGGMFADL
ncbi:MAG: SDR family oxidoreductase [Gammaproteobacteria bacterium]|nr:SDR family oxidoreductase [Gammaproteobacteria bacterium]